MLLPHLSFLAQISMIFWSHLHLIINRLFTTSIQVSVYHQECIYKPMDIRAELSTLISMMSRMKRGEEYTARDIRIFSSIVEL